MERRRIIAFLTATVMVFAFAVAMPAASLDALANNHETAPPPSNNHDTGDIDYDGDPDATDPDDDDDGVLDPDDDDDDDDGIPDTDDQVATPLPPVGPPQQETRPPVDAIETRPTLTPAQAQAVINTAGITVTGAVTAGGQTVAIAIQPVTVGHANQFQSWLHNAVEQNNVEGVGDGSQLLSVFHLDTGGVAVGESITITLTVPGVEAGGSYIAMYYDGQWHWEPVTVLADGTVQVTLHGINSLLAIVRTVAPPTQPTPPARPWTPTVAAATYHG